MIEITIALIIFLFPLAYSPGPGNMFFAANGARFGFAATVPSNIGYHITTWLVTVVIGLGMITALNDYPNVFLTLKISGAAYVLWLAWKLIRAGRYDGHGEAKPATFWDGVIFAFTEPESLHNHGIDVQPVFVNRRGPANCECFDNFDYIHA